MISVALSIAVMIVTLSVLLGFKQQITEKVTGFLAHVQIVNYDGNTSFETNPINSNQDFLSQIKAIDNVSHTQTYALKAGIISSGNNMQGVVLKGVDSNFDWSFFNSNMVDGKGFEVNDSAGTSKVCISLKLAQMLQLKLGDNFDAYFVQNPPRVRRFNISGIFDTKFGEFDKLYVLCDIKHPQRLNGWSNEQITGFEIYLKNFDKLNDTYADIANIAAYKLQPDGSRLAVESVKERYGQIFQWLALQDMNAMVIFVLMLAVAGFNMISGLLIILLERSGTIGLLMTLGMRNRNLQKVFVYQAGFIALQGLVWGNVIGIAICLLQKYFGIVLLNPDTYYLSQVPIAISWGKIVLLNLGAIMAITGMLVLPSLLVARVKPSKTLRFN
ncbi:MAG: ABC transporter permease [Prevotellaceae bacterium]|jgi:lipoprotein-releasing system permease protein|nr:ABC transporter permease [Prevotellaceae bacterium]